MFGLCVTELGLRGQLSPHGFKLYKGGSCLCRVGTAVLVVRGVTTEYFIDLSLRGLSASGRLPSHPYHHE